MSWGKIDDRMPEHPKWTALERSAGARVWADAMATWMVVLCYSNRNETDGEIERTLLERISPIGKSAVKAAEAMVAVRLMERTEHGYRLYAFTEYNPSKAQKVAARKSDADRKKSPKGFPSDSGRNGAGLRPDSDRIPNTPTRPDPIPSPTLANASVVRAREDSPGQRENQVRSTVTAALVAAGRPAPPLDTSSRCQRIADWCQDHAKATGAPFDDVLDRLSRGFAAAADPKTAKAGWPLAYLAQNPGQYITQAPSNPTLGGGETDAEMLASLRRTA